MHHHSHFGGHHGHFHDNWSWFDTFRLHNELQAIDRDLRYRNSLAYLSSPVVAKGGDASGCLGILLLVTLGGFAFLLLVAIGTALGPNTERRSDAEIDSEPRATNYGREAKNAAKPEHASTDRD